MALANYTTTVPASRSIQLIQDILARAGATAVLLDYSNCEPSAISFRIERNGKQMGFRMPADWKRCLAVLNRTKEVPVRLKSNDHAKRVAWRNVHDWLRAQIALVEIDQADFEQVMLPYCVTPAGQTLYEQFKSNNFLQLTERVA